MEGRLRCSTEPNTAIPRKAAKGSLQLVRSATQLHGKFFRQPRSRQTMQKSKSVNTRGLKAYSSHQCRMVECPGAQVLAGQWRSQLLLKRGGGQAGGKASVKRGSFHVTKIRNA